MITDIQSLEQRVADGRLKAENKIHRAIGRLKERYPRVARYYNFTYDAAKTHLRGRTVDKNATPNLDGSYVLKTDRQDLTGDEIWRTYILLTRVEDAFRDMKRPLMERPIFHHLEVPTPTFFFACWLTISWPPLSTASCRLACTPPGGPFAINSKPIKSSPSSCLKIIMAAY